MKSIVKLVFLLMMAVITLPLSATNTSDDRIVISFSQEIAEKSGEMIYVAPQTDVNLTKAASAERGIINLVNINNSVPSAIMSAARAAADMWEIKLKNKTPIYIGISYENLNNSKTALSCDVIYYTYPNCIPSALLSQSQSYPNGAPHTPDATIRLNKQFNWDLTIDSTSTSTGINAFTAVSRGIAQSLGFGTTLTTDSGNLNYRMSTQSAPFNNLIFSSEGVWLKDLFSQQDIAAFAQPSSSKIYVLKKNDNYMLYAPQVFEEGKSLTYLNNRYSLMHHAFGYGDKFFDIDSTVIDILNAIGWNVSTSGNITIKPSRGMNENGIGNVYEKFSLFPTSTPQKDITNPKWDIYLIKESGERVLYHESSSKLLCMNLIPNPENYVCSDGLVHGEAVFECTIDGKNIVPQPYHFLLSLKPGDISITSEFVMEDPYYISFFAKVHQKGADKVQVQYYNDDENSDATCIYYKYYYQYEDFDIELEKDFYDDSPCVVILSFKNEYGTTTKSIRHDPNKPNGDVIISKPPTIIETHAITTIMVYDINGNYIGTYDYLPGCEADLGQGTYVINYLAGNEVVQTKKIIIK